MTGALLRIAAALVVALVCASGGRADESDWPQTLVIGTASPGGTYHAYGEGLAQLLSRKLGLSVITRPTEGPTENLKLLEADEIQLAFVTLGIAQQGWNGAGEWTNGKQLRAARALFPMYDTPFHFIVRSDSDIRSIADLAGKRLGIGPQGGTGGIYTPLVLKALKMDATFASGSWTDLASQFSARQLEALIVLGGVPVPEVAELEKKGNIRYLTLTPNQVVALRLALPELASSLVAAGTYPSLVANKNLEAGGYPLDLVVNGQRAMPPFGAMMSDDQVAAVVNYLRTHFDNNYQDAVTAEDVKIVRR